MGSPSQHPPKPDKGVGTDSGAKEGNLPGLGVPVPCQYLRRPEWPTLVSCRKGTWPTGDGHGVPAQPVSGAEAKFRQ